MTYFGSGMLSVGRTVIRAIRARNNNRWNVSHQLRESFKKRRSLMLVWRYTIYSGAQTVLAPAKINFLKTAGSNHCCIASSIKHESLPISNIHVTTSVRSLLSPKACIFCRISVSYRTQGSQQNNMAKPKLVLYIDVVSPFAYLAFHILNVCRFICIGITIQPCRCTIIPQILRLII